MNPKHLLFGLVALGVTALIGLNFWPWKQGSQTPDAEFALGEALVDVVVPELSAEATRGRAAYDVQCSTCHGKDAAGQDGIAPPLVHGLYEPNHHADIAFVLAAKNGVRAHHWRFGNMPPVEGISDEEIALIITYVRELQRANGIF